MRGIQASSLEIRADSPGIKPRSAFNKNGFAALFAIKAAQYRPLRFSSTRMVLVRVSTSPRTLYLGSCSIVYRSSFV